MEVVIKDKWVNEEAKCRLCTKIFCCTEHRIAHEKYRHLKERVNALSDISNQKQFNITARAIKVPQLKHEKPAAKPLQAVKIKHSPDCTRKRKIEAMASPTSQLKKTKRIFPKHMRTPGESPKSPLALVNNGIKSNSTVVMTSSPFTSPTSTSFVSLSLIDNASPVEEPCVKRETIELENSVQSNSSNLQGDNMSRKLSLDSNHSDTSLRDCNISDDIFVRPMPVLLNDMGSNMNDSFICISDELKSHPHITYERKKNTNMLELSFDLISNENFDDQLEKSIPILNKSLELISEPDDNVEIANAKSETQLEAIGYMDVETKELYFPVDCFGIMKSNNDELSSILEVNHSPLNSGVQDTSETETDLGKTTIIQNESDFHPPAQSTFKTRESSTATDSTETPTMISASSKQSQTSSILSSPLDDIYAVSTMRCSEKDTRSLSTQPSKIINTPLSLLHDKEPRNEEESECSQISSDTDILNLKKTPRNHSDETKSCLDESIISARFHVDNSSLRDESIRLSGVKFNTQIRINNMYLMKPTLMRKIVSSVKNKILSLLPFRFSMKKTCTPTYTIVDLDLHGDYSDDTETHIRGRDPIREYPVTLEMSRKLLNPIEGRPPYHVPESLASLIVTLEKNESNESLSSEDEENEKKL